MQHSYPLFAICPQRKHLFQSIITCKMYTPTLTFKLWLFDNETPNRRHRIFWCKKLIHAIPTEEVGSLRVGWIIRKRTDRNSTNGYRIVIVRIN
ncbi:hypothetical protein ABW12_18565 [Pluralibacter gergoviae]|nr:hypothetical protein ABW12_18565 [Pluralibacter gergoviae]